MIILLCGYKRSGKDTFATYIEEKYGFKHHKFANGLKHGLKYLFGFNHAQLEGDKKEEIDVRWGISPRDAMIFVGTYMFQHEIQKLIPNIKRNFWVKQLMDEIDINDNIVISDLRFIHEYEYMKTNICVPIYVVKIINPKLLIYQKDMDETETEHLQLKFDKIIMNDENYFTNIDKLMYDLRYNKHSEHRIL
tara:strand:- start:31 stop:606 length:576 start_codon:yes stop_codon:yes gene_type:complete